MKALLQRVLKAEVSSEGQPKHTIAYGMVIFLGIAETDTKSTADKLINKIVNIRMFDGQDSKFGKSLLEIKGDALVVSQFTLFADTSHGRRPSFLKAANPEKARELFEYFCKKLAENYLIKVKFGKFADRMIVDAKNLGPFSILIETTS